MLSNSVLLSKETSPAFREARSTASPHSLSSSDKNSHELLERLKTFLDASSLISPSAQDRAIRLPEVLHLLGIGKSTWYDRLNCKSPSYDPSAPKPFKLGSGSRSPSVWWHSEIQSYLSVRASASHAAENEVEA